MQIDEIDIVRFLGKEVWYDKHGQMIFAKNEKEGNQLILDLRGWGAIQHLYKKEDGSLDLDKAAVFQDELGKWIAEAINLRLREYEDNLKRQTSGPKLGIIGHVGHGTTCSTKEEIIAMMKEHGKKIVIVGSDAEFQEPGIKANLPDPNPIEKLTVYGSIHDGRSSRRERRKNERKYGK